MDLNFEWDEEKAKKNLRNHQVGFEDAKAVFNDPFLITFPDPEHAIGEQRYLNIGLSAKGRVLIVVHTERGGNIRIISCRKATTSERRDYEEGNF
ncbi:BrnT family toxin [candidate division KSB1 bacterium]|nr:BrnT family toxin [candidate division KSB1 bacterium]